MKKMKKLASLLLALVMTLAMAMPVFAAAPTEPTESIERVEQGTSQAVNGEITISNAIVGQTYDLYRIFELQSYNNESEAYTYIVVPEWRNFCVNGEGAAYVDVNKQDYVTWKKDVAQDDATAAEFAVKALAYAKAHTEEIGKTATENEEPTYDAVANPSGKKKGDTTEITFSPLKLGYYLVDSTVGTLCSLTTTNNIQTIIDKNEKPTVEKEVEEDDEEDATKKYGDDNDAMIGQLVNYRTTITAQKGAINYTLHDKMTGLDFEEVKTVVLEKADGVTKDELTEGEEYSVKTADVCPKGCSFEVVFDDTFAATLENGDKIIVEYSAKVNASAVIAGTGNPNTTSLTYGDDVTNLNETDEDETRTYTFKFDLVKTNSKDELLSGATFRLFENQTGGTALQFVKKEDGSYRVATDSDTNTTADIVVEGGKTTIIGLDGNSSYYLEETVAPNGYNKLAGRVEVQLSEKVKGTDGNVNVNIGSGDQAGSVDAIIELENKKYVSGGVEVENNAGTLLPSTGGIGTTIFYVVGTILVLGAGILLVTKRRMKAQ